MDYEELSQLIISKDVEGVKLHINKDNCDISNTKRGLSLFHLSVNVGNMEIIQHFVESGCNINLHTKKGTGPISLAITRGHHDVFHYLLKKGADIYNHPRRNLIELSFHHKHYEIAAVLINKMKNENHYSELEDYYKKCLCTSNYNNTKKLLELGVNPNGYGNTRPIVHVLSDVKYSMKYDMLELLIKHGVNVSVKDERIFQLIRQNLTLDKNREYYYKITKLLLKNGAMFHLREMLSISYINKAYYKKFTLMVMKYTLPLADKNKRENIYNFFKEWSAPGIYHANDDIFYIILRKLLKYGYSVNNIATYERSRFKGTCSMNILALLNRYNADFNILFEKSGKNGTMGIMMSRDSSIAIFLLENGLIPEYIPESVYTMFHCSNSTKSDEIIKKFLLYGVPFSEKIKDYYRFRGSNIKELVINWPKVVPLTVLCIRSVFRNRVNVEGFPQILLQLPD